MNFDEDSSSSSSGDELPMFDTVQGRKNNRHSSPPAAAVRHADPSVERSDDDADGVDEDSSGINADIPEWAQNLQRPGTSSLVGKYSDRQDEFTRHLNFTEDPDVEVSPQRERSSQPRSHRGGVQSFDEEGENSTHFSEHMENSVGRNRSTTSNPRRGGSGQDDVGSPNLIEDGDDGVDDIERRDGGGNGDDSEEAFPITEAAQWDSYLQSGVLVDETPFTQLYSMEEEVAQEEEEEEGSDDDSDEEVRPKKKAGVKTVSQIFKVFCPPLPDDAIATDFDRVRRLTERLCRSMLSSAETIANNDHLRDRVICNIEEVHCDSQTRIIVQVASHHPCVTLGDIAAFTTVTSEHIRIIATTVVRNLVRLHEDGLVHGSLHGGNALIHLASGSLKFTDGTGLLSCPVLAPDFSFMSTHLASHIKDLLPTELDPNGEPNSFLNEMWAAFYEDPYQEAFRDDAVAVAHLIAMLVNGFPSRFGMCLTEVVDDVDSHPSPVLLTLTTGGDYFAQRAAAAGFTEEFLHSAQSLIDVLVGTESLAQDDVLEHSFLISSKQIDADATGELEQQFAEFLLQIAQEASRAIEFSKITAGSSPMNLRLFRNAIFSSNIQSCGTSRRTNSEVAHILPEGVSFVGTDTVVVEGSQLQISLLNPLPTARTILIIRKVEDASIVILSKFHHIVLRDVSNSTIALGPCRVCLLEDLARCPRVAVAAVQAILSRVADVELSLHSADVPMCPDPSTISNVTIVPYSVSYPGLTRDFEDIGLPQESQASLLSYQVPDAVERRAPQELFANIRTGHDYPYLRAMATMGKRIVHSGTLDDLYLFHDEVRDYKIVIQEVRGGPLSGSGSHMLLAPDSPSRNTRHVFPVIMIVDSVEDVYISDCENVTVVVIGAKGAINVSNVRHAKLFLAGAYVMLSDCSHCEVHAFALKGAMIEGCERIIVFPVFASFPGIDGVIQQMAEANGVEGEVSGADNLFLTPRVQVQNNNGVDVHQRPQLLVSLDAPELGECPSALFSQQTAPAGAKLIPVNFSSSLFEGHHLALESGSVLERSSDVVVQISYMIDASILRTAGMLCPGRKPALPTDPSTNLIISHVHTGVIHVADAVAHLTIVGCTGPLDIVVAAAQQVTVSDCTGITVQVACFGFTAAHCRNCHFALHVNTEPKIEQRCENVLFSALNITCLGYEDVLDRASVQQHLNLYDHPVDADTAAIGPSIATSTGISVESLGATLRVSDAASARKLLERRCFIAPPLPATCVGTAEAPFLGALEDRVEKDQSRPNVYLTLFEALSTVASSRLDEITDESLLVGDRRHSISHSDEGREDDDRPQRPSARLGQRSRKHDHYDSSSDDEEDNDEEVNESGHSSNTTSPRKVASQTQQSPAQSDSDSSPVKSAAASAVPPQHQAPAQPAFVGSMSAANRDDSSSSSSSDADDDSEKHQSPNRYENTFDNDSEDDEEYSHRGGGNAMSPMRHEHVTDAARFDGDISSAERSVEPAALPRSDSPSNIAISEEEPVIPTRRGVGSPDHKQTNPLRQDVADFKAFLASGGGADNTPSPKRSSSRYEASDGEESDGIELAVGDDDDDDDDDDGQRNDNSSQDAVERNEVAALGQKSPSPSKERKAKLDLGFDDTTSSESDNEGTTTTRKRPVLNHEAALAAMGLSSDAAARIGTRTTRVHADPASLFDDVLPDIPAHDDSAVDVSEDAMSRIRSRGAPKTQSPNKSSSSSPRKASREESDDRVATHDDEDSAIDLQSTSSVDEPSTAFSPNERGVVENSDHESLNATSPGNRQETDLPTPASSPHRYHSTADDPKEESYEGKETASTSNASLPGVLAGADSPEDLAVSMVSDRTVIFLDIDGVVVPVSPMSFGGGDIDPTCIKHLKAIVDQCGSLVTIVLTSTWRHDEAKKARLNAAFVQAGIPLVTLGVPNGVPEPTEVTYLQHDPQEQGLVRDRVDEIFSFAENSASMFPEAFRGGRWLAIDDMNLGLDPRMAGHFLLTDTEEGLTSVNVSQAAAIVANFPHFSPSASATERQAQVNEVLRHVGASFCSNEDLMLPLGIEQTSDFLASSTTRGRSTNGSASHTSMLTSIDSEEELRRVSSSSLDEQEKNRVIHVVKEIQSLRRSRSELVDAMGDLTSRVSRALEKLSKEKKQHDNGSK